MEPRGSRRFPVVRQVGLAHPNNVRLRMEIEQLKIALAEAMVQLRIWQRGAAFADQALRRPRGPKRASGSAGFVLAGIPERTYRRRLARRSWLRYQPTALRSRLPRADRKAREASRSAVSRCRHTSGAGKIRARHDDDVSAL